MPARQRLDGAEDVGCSAAFIFIVTFGRSVGFGSGSGAKIAVQHYGLFIQGNHRFLWIVGFLVNLQHVVHAFPVGLIDLGHAPHFFPATA